MVDDFLAQCQGKEMVVDGRVGSLAIDAVKTFGKAVGHPAELNFGDCFSYACAKSHQLDLLYMGNEFAKTDLA